MRIFVPSKPQEVPKICLSCSGGEEVSAPYDFRHAHQSVVYHHGELIGKYAITSSDEKIAAVTCEILAIGPIYAIDYGEI